MILHYSSRSIVEDSDVAHLAPPLLVLRDPHQHLAQAIEHLLVVLGYEELGHPQRHLALRLALAGDVDANATDLALVRDVARLDFHRDRKPGARDGVIELAFVGDQRFVRQRAVPSPATFQANRAPPS